MRAPFPWFGGKRRVADAVWRRFGDVPNYVEPFAGSLAVLLGRPDAPRTETVNDKDCYLANFWRAIHSDPDAVAQWADGPVNEADLHARHLWLVNQGEFIERMKREPDYFDAKIAGWWVWGICCWIGSGWCASNTHTKNEGINRVRQNRPHVSDAGRGINRVHQNLPHVSDASRGVHRKRIQAKRGGVGVHRSGLGLGNAAARTEAIKKYFAALSDRLRNTRVCCGDWKRVLGPCPTEYVGLTGVFLDPPYAGATGRDATVYAEDDLEVSVEVAEWAVSHGDNPKLRIALCGYAGEHEMPGDWECFAWKASGGYANAASKPDENNAHRERIWFSPSCLSVQREEQDCFDFDLAN